MRIFLVIILSAISIGLSSQSDLSAFIKKLSKEFNIEVAVDPTLLDEKRYEINQPIQNIDEVYTILKKIGLDYYVVSNNYILLRKSNQEKTIKTISGRIIDQKTGQPLAYASVYTKNMSSGTSTDADGRFSLKVSDNPPHVLEVSYLGYENKEFTNNGNNNIGLVEKVNDIKEVIIIAAPFHKLDFASPQLLSDYHNYTILKLQSNDLARSIQLSVPGISRTDNAQIMIRNMRQDKTLSLVNNIPVLKTGHYFNSISNFNELYFNQIDIYKNVFPPQYGSVLGGMVQYSNVVDRSKPFALSTTTNLLYSGIAAQINHKNLAISVGARRSYIGMNKKGLLKNNLYQLNTAPLDSSGIVPNIPDAAFHDENIQVQYKYSHKGTIVINGLNSYDEDKLVWEKRNQYLIGGPSLDITQKFSNKETSKQNAFSFSNDLILNSKWRWHTDAHHYNYKDSFLLLSKTINIFDNKTVENDDSYSHYQKISSSSIHSGIDYTIDSFRQMSAGVLIKQLDLQFSAFENTNAILGLNQQANQITMYDEYSFGSKNYRAKAGLKASYFSTHAGLYMEPYMTISYKVTEGLLAKASFAHRIQNLNLMDFETRFSQNLNYYYLSGENNPLQKGDHYMLGVNYKISKLTFDLEAYQYNNTGNVLFTNVMTGFKKDKNPGGPPQPPFINTYKFFSGTNTIRGIDFSLHYIFNQWQTNINYTLSKSEQTFSGIYRNQTIPSPTDRRHALSINNTFNFGKWTLGNNIAYMSGSPYLSYKVVKQDRGKNEISRGEVIDYLPDYFSLDFVVNYGLTFKACKVNLGFSVNNLTNNNNVKFIQQTGSFDEKKNGQPIVTGNESLMLGRFFNFHIKTKF